MVGRPGAEVEVEECGDLFLLGNEEGPGTCMFFWLSTLFFFRRRKREALLPLYLSTTRVSPGLKSTGCDRQENYSDKYSDEYIHEWSEVRKDTLLRKGFAKVSLQSTKALQHQWSTIHHVAYVVLVSLQSSSEDTNS